MLTGTLETCSSEIELLFEFEEGEKGTKCFACGLRDDEDCFVSGAAEEMTSGFELQGGATTLLLAKRLLLTVRTILAGGNTMTFT